MSMRRIGFRLRDEILEDKSIFYLYCTASEIPVPKLYALYFKRSPGWSYNGVFLRSEEEWQGFLRNDLPQEFVIKPARGVYGDQVLTLSRNQDTFLDPHGKSFTSDQIYRIFATNRTYDSFIIQERLKNQII